MTGADMTRNGLILARTGVASLLAVVLAGMSMPSAAQNSESKTSPTTATKSANGTMSEVGGAAGKGAIRLPDGTWLWIGNDGNHDRISIPWKDYLKLLAERDQLRKQSQSRKPITPSLCAIRVRIEKRGEQWVAVVRISNSFRTTASQTSVLLGGRKGLLTAATLDGGRLPILDNNEEGYLATVETAGEHTIVLDLETPITSRGNKGEVGFELGLPRAAITTLQIEPTGSDISRINLVTRWSDPSQPNRTPEVRRLSGLDIRQFGSTPGKSGGYPLGPVESLEVTWDPPARSPAADRVQTAEWDITVTFSEATVETIAKVTLRGTVRQWRIVTPGNALVHAERPPGFAEIGPGLPPTIQRSGNKGEWLVEFPPNSTSSDWVVVASVQTMRPRPDEPGHRGSFAIGPFAALNVFGQTGTLRLQAGPYTRFVVRHRTDLRRLEAPGSDEERSTALFRLNTGPVGNQIPTQPLATVEVQPVRGSLVLSPHYQVTLKPNGWHIETKLKVEPVRREVDALLVEIPPQWRGVEVGPPDIVEGVQSEPPLAPVGFWQSLAHRISSEPRIPLIIRLANSYKQPVQITLTALYPLATTTQEVLLPLPRFPGANLTPTQVYISVPEDLQVQGHYREWLGGHTAPTGSPLKPLPASGSRGGSVSQLQASSEQPIAAVFLQWKPYRPDLAADSRVEMTLNERQILVQQTFRLRTNESLPRTVQLQGSETVVALASNPALEAVGPGHWRWSPLPEGREAVLTLEYTLPRSPELSRLNIRLFHVLEATRGEHLVRLWSATPFPELIQIRTPGWRDRPLEPHADYATWPLRVLSAPQGETQLELEVQPRQDMAVTVWVERGLIQAWVGEEGTLRYRARFRLRRWLTRSLNLELPALNGPHPEFFVDGRRLEPVTFQRTEQGTYVYQLPLPEPRLATRLLVEVRYVLPAPSNWQTILLPPLLSNTAWDGPTWWHVALPGGTLPLLYGPLQPRWRWRWQTSGITLASWSEAELEQWLMGDSPLANGRNSLANGETTVASVTGLQAIPTSFLIGHVPHGPVVFGCSLIVLLYLVFLSRVASDQRIIGLAATGLLLALGLAIAPYDLLQLLTAGQIGLYVALLTGSTVLALRWYRQRQIRYLPGFRRDAAVYSPTPDSKVPVVSTGSRRASNTGPSTPGGRLAPASSAPGGSH